MLDSIKLEAIYCSTKNQILFSFSSLLPSTSNGNYDFVCSILKTVIILRVRSCRIVLRPFRSFLRIDVPAASVKMASASWELDRNPGRFFLLANPRMTRTTRCRAAQVISLFYHKTLDCPLGEFFFMARFARLLYGANYSVVDGTVAEYWRVGSRYFEGQSSSTGCRFALEIESKAASTSRARSSVMSITVTTNGTGEKVYPAQTINSLLYFAVKSPFLFILSLVGIYLLVFFFG